MRYRSVNNTDTEIDSQVSFSKYVVRGKVVNEDGEGIWGIAVKVGNELIVSDSAGDFFTHVRNSKPLPISVSASNSLQTIGWALVNAPTVAKAGTDSRIVIRMAENKETASICKFNGTTVDSARSDSSVSQPPSSGSLVGLSRKKL